MHRLALPTLLLALASCALVRAATGAGLQRPTLAYQSWSADQLDLEGVTLTLHYRLENPNDFELDLRRLDYLLQVEGHDVGRGALPGGLRVPAAGAGPVAFSMRLRWRDVPGFVRLLVDRSDVEYRVTGTASVGSPLGTVDLPFDHRDRVALPRAPAVSLVAVKVREASLSNLSLDVRLRIENGNSFPLPVGALTYGLRVGDREIVSGGSHPLVAVPPRGSAVVSVPIRIGLRGMADALTDVLRGAELRLRGLMGIGGLELPIDIPGEVGAPPAPDGLISSPPRAADRG